MLGNLKTCTLGKLSFSLLYVLLSLTTFSQNAIQVENALTGNPKSEWDIVENGDPSIQGFATDVSVNVGGTIYFKINTDAAAYSIDIYRLGYYGGLGARKWGEGTITATVPQSQPAPYEDISTGIVDCGTWDVSAHWDVPLTAVSGYYIALLKRGDDPSKKSHILFIVRDDASTSDLFFQASDATWQAYNFYGGASLYAGSTTLPAGRAHKVSYNRPQAGGAQEDWIFNSEYPMIRFLERNGYDISYTSNTDIHRDGARILQHKVFLSVGHDEYWTAEQRTAVENARNAGVHLAFFSGNEIYWKTRFENSYDGANTANRTLVCYKEGRIGELDCGYNCDPANQWTGLWRDADGAAEGGYKPENELSGQISWDGTIGSIKVPSDYKDFRFWRNTSIASLTGENEKTFPFGTLGYEWNFEQEAYKSFNPPGRITFSRTTVGGKTHKLSLYKHNSGALVFGAGTVQWAWGLDETHDGAVTPTDIDMQQATINILADMGVQPETLMPTLVAATASTDVQAPITIITTPANNSSTPVFKPTVISGTASDNATVASIEISFDNGVTWETVDVSGTSWSHTWIPYQIGSFVIKVRGVDDSGNIEAAGTAPAANAITITVGAPEDPECPCTLFENTDAPTSVDLADEPGGIEVGMKFKSLMDGYIKSIRFYKSPGATGQHTGSVWDLSGNLLSSIVFTNLTASGWQEMSLTTPLAVTANTVYVVSVHSANGVYAKSPFFFSGPHINSPLIALSNGDLNGPNGVFKYTNSPAFPNQSFNADNYFVDVVFDTEIGPDVVAPLITRSRPIQEGSNVGVGKNLLVYFNESLDGASISASTVELRDAGNVVVSGTVAYNNAYQAITFTPSAPLAYASAYTLQLIGGASGIKDVAGNAMAADTSIQFTTEDVVFADPANGPGGPILVVHSNSNPYSRYTAEILRAEGLNHFTVMEIGAVDATVLQNYDVVVLGEVAVSALQATMFSDFVNAGGTFIAFKPDADLETLLGITNAGGTLSDQYLLFNPANALTSGLVNQTIQFHSSANQYNLNGASSLATLYSNATTATAYPAVTIYEVGSNGGKAIAFAYDLARSIVYTRQGNPAWASQKRDGTGGPIRASDMFFGTGGSNHWIDLDKVAIPQADEQQRLLSNIIVQSNLHRKPLPKFWFLPQGYKAAIIMTGDDHGNNGTTGRFQNLAAMGPNTAQDVKDWKAIRSTSYVYPDTPIDPALAESFEDNGFEISLHPTTSCENFNNAELHVVFTDQLGELATNFPGLTTPGTNRTHCMVWSDWATMAKVSAEKGIRLDVNYYYWPDSWVQNRAGMFTGSGLPMRFADVDGTILNIYQAPTQMTDESGITYSTFVNSLLDKAIGPEGYYGVFTANMHTDSSQHIGATTIINAAKARNLPVVSARQMLNWLEGRDGSSFNNLVWNNNELSFSVDAKLNAYKMQGMLPMLLEAGILSGITRNGSAASFTVQTIKGIQYAFFDASTANYIATYVPAQFATLNGTVNLQGRPAAPNARWSVPLKVELFASGNNTTPVYSYDVTTDQSGNFTISNIPAGTYSIAVKNAQTLRRVIADHVLVEGTNALSIGTLLAGDVTPNNSINLNDLTAIVQALNKIPGNPLYNVNADINMDGVINLNDLTLLISNFNILGQNP